MITTAIKMFQRGGYAATSWRKLVQESGAPWGSARHYFPDGKEQLGVEAVAVAAKIVADQMERCFPPRGDGVAAIRMFFTAAADQLERSNYCAGCPIATVALEMTPGSPAVTEACRSAMELWHQTLKGCLIRAGVEVSRAADSAQTILTLFEGGLVLARVLQSRQPLIGSAEAAIRLLQAEWPDSDTPGSISS